MTPEEAFEALKAEIDEVREALNAAEAKVAACKFGEAAGMLEATGHNLEISAMMLQRKLPAS